MKFIVRNILFLMLFVLSANNLYASRVKKGYEALEVRDYFKAKKMLSKGMKYNPEVASFGLSIIFSRNDNPFYNIDSAYHYVIIADTSWSYAKDGKKEKWGAFGWTRQGIDSMKVSISSQFYQVAKSAFSVESFTKFIELHPWASEFSQAVKTRDSLAFFEVMESNTAEEYHIYMTTYPNSEYAPMAKDNYYNSQFNELTGDDSLTSYLQFIEEHTNSPMRVEAERRVYQMVTEPNTIEAYELFVLGYSENSFQLDAWREFYQLYLSDYSKDRITDFLVKYPDNPIRKEIVSDIVMCDSLLLPYYEIEKYGFMNTNGEMVFNAVYDFVGPFKNGLAPVVKDEKYGFLNKRGEIQVPIEYESVSDFVDGRCVVEKDEKQGLIDRNVKVLLKCEYEEIGEPSSGLLFLKNGEQYGYVDINGREVISSKFDQAYDFIGSFAMVETDEKQAMINTKGEYMISPMFDELTPIDDTLYAAVLNGRKGVVSENGTYVIAPKYDQIGAFKDGLALVSFGDTIQYINKAGEVVISKDFRTFPNFLLKGEFKNGGAIVYKKGKYGRINTKGDVITDIEHQNLGSGEKFIPFQKQEFWGLLSLSNKLLISAKYESVDLVDNRFVIATMEDSLGVMDVQGNKLIPFSFNAIEFIKDDYFIVRQGNKLGLYKGATEVLNIEYDQIGLFGDYFVHLNKSGYLSYYDLTNARLIERRVEDE